MDESHLKAPSVHVNTADVPTSVAGKATIPVLVSGVILVIGWLTSCGGGHQAISLPPALSYNGSQPFPAVVGEAIALTPAVTGSIDGYAVNPELPSGLVLNGVTGVISGTPTRASEAATFTITATYRDRHSTFPLVLSVTEPPSHLLYPNPAKATVGAPLAPMRPKIAGRAEHFSVTPALPAGVVLDSMSGLITGTPSVARPLAAYTITASSQAGNASFVLLLAVAAPSPSSNH